MAIGSSNIHLTEKGLLIKGALTMGLFKNPLFGLGPQYGLPGLFCPLGENPFMGLIWGTFSGSGQFLSGASPGTFINAEISCVSPNLWGTLLGVGPKKFWETLL